jgi:Protein of unknown function (DUF3298)/Deacetylase PdaC
MNKRFGFLIPALFFLFNLTNSKSQDYRIVQMSMAEQNKNGTYEFSVSYPVIKDFKENVTSMNMFNELIKRRVFTLRDTFNVWMKDWDTPKEMTGIGSYYEAGDSVFYANNNLISIQFYEGYYFAGAAHPNNSSFSINYDLVNNRELTLGDLLSEGWEKKVSEICIKILKELKNVPHGTEDEWIERGAGPVKKNFEVFNITKKGILITFITYQVGSYAEGPSEVLINYSDIKDIIPAAGYMENALKQLIR